MVSNFVDKLETKSRGLYWSPDCIRPIERDMAAAIAFACGLSRSWFDRNLASNTVPALVLILSSMMSKRSIVLAAQTAAVDFAAEIHIRRANRAIDILAHSSCHFSCTDAFPVVVAFRAMTMMWAQHMRHSWSIVSAKYCRDPYLNPTIRHDAVADRRSDAQLCDECPTEHFVRHLRMHVPAMSSDSN